MWDSSKRNIKLDQTRVIDRAYLAEILHFNVAAIKVIRSFNSLVGWPKYGLTIFS